MNKTLAKLISLVLILSFAIGLTSCKANNAESVEIYALDTIITITAYGASREAFDAAKAEIKRLEALLSATNSQSDISRINNSQGEFVKVSDECIFLLKTAYDVSEITDGSFDISVYPAVRLWGFADDNYHVPSDSELSNVKEFIDYSKITFDDADKSVSVPNGFSLDLGAIAKGYIADKTALVLEAYGVSSALLNFGGNIRLVGSKPDGSAWNIGIKAPYSSGYFATISLSGITASTAGGYERYFEENGKTYHHILNPHTASPADTDALSATVIGERGELCDALATSAFVKGTDGITDLAEAYPDYSFVLYTENAVYASEAVYDNINLTQEYSDLDIIKI